jgi:hypothetical protein
LGAALLGPVAAAHVGGPGGELSERELEVLRLVALGHTNAEIAETSVPRGAGGGAGTRPASRGSMLSRSTQGSRKIQSPLSRSLPRM